MVNIGEYSSHSPGWVGGRNSSLSSLETSIFIASAVTAVSGPGADQTAITTETTRRETVITADCHRKIVSENGMTPVIGRRLFGRLAAFAWSCAAEEDSAHGPGRPKP